MDFIKPSSEFAFTNLQVNLDNLNRKVTKEIGALKFLLDGLQHDYVSSNTYRNQLAPALPRYGVLLAYGLVESSVKASIIAYLVFLKESEAKIDFLVSSLPDIIANPTSNNTLINFEKWAMIDSDAEIDSNHLFGAIDIDVTSLKFKGNTYHEYVCSLLDDLGLDGSKLKSLQEPRKLDKFYDTLAADGFLKAEGLGALAFRNREIQQSIIECFPVNSNNVLVELVRSNSVRHPLDWLVRMRNQFAHGVDFVANNSMAVDDKVFGTIAKYARKYVMELTDFVIKQVFNGVWVKSQYKQKWDDCRNTFQSSI